MAFPVDMTHFLLTQHPRECIICFNEAECSMRVYPCKHSEICRDCLLQLANEKHHKDCPQCRTPIERAAWPTDMMFGIGVRAYGYPEPYFIKINFDMTIADVKQIMQKEIGVPSSDLILRYGGRRLPDDESVWNARIMRDSTVTLDFKRL